MTGVQTCALPILGAGIGAAGLTATVAWLARRAPTRHRALAAVGFLVFALADATIGHHLTSGLESPATLALLAAVLWQMPLAAAILAMHKIDLVPAGILALPKRGRVVACVAIVTFYAAASLYFGSVGPLPLQTKLVWQRQHVDAYPPLVGHDWFALTVYAAGMHRWATVLAPIAVLPGPAREWARLPVALLLTHTLAWTMFPPFEAYSWYAVPGIWAALVLGAVGLGRAADGIVAVSERPGWPRYLAPFAWRFAPLAVLLALAVLHLPETLADARRLQAWSAEVDGARAKIGDWIAANTPTEAVVRTPWGLPAWRSRRRVYDSAFLNNPPGDPPGSCPACTVRVENADVPVEAGWVLRARIGGFAAWTLANEP